MGTWLAVITARTALNHVRSASRKEGKRFAELAPVQAAPQDSLGEYLERLPPRQRAAVALRYCEGMRTREIAEALGLKPASVTSILGRAIRELGRLAARPILRS
jgi:RNA polymerase sigma factor (sigma-70 family)